VTAAAAPARAGDRLATRLPARFLGWATALPEATVTNADLEAVLDTSDAWITERTGIRQRRVAGPEDTTASLAVTAGRRCLARAGLDPGVVDMVVLATMTPDSTCPATAAAVAHRLGTAGAAFDLNAACAGFVYGLAAGASMLATPGIDHVLVVGADRVTAVVDPADRGTAVLFGDGAGAVVLGSPTPDEEVDAGPGLLGVDLGGDGAGLVSLQVPPGQRYLYMDGPDVFRRATRGMVDSCVAALDRAGAGPGDVDLFVPHQANIRIIDAAVSRLGIPADRVMVNLDRYGNTSAASVPIALAEAADSGRVEPGSVVLACGIGAGMAWATAVLRWGP